MAGSTVYNDVVNRIKVEADASVQAGFNKLAAGAREAGQATEQAGQKGSTGLKGLAGELRQTDRGFGQLQHGVFGLLGTMSLLDDSGKWGKGLAIFSVLHSGTQTVRGLAGALPAVGALAGAASLPLVAIGGAVAAIVALSPGLQRGLGDALNHITGKAQEAAEALKRMHEQGEDIARMTATGGATAAVEAKVAARIAAMRPFNERGLALTEKGNAARAQLTWAGAYPESARMFEGEDRQRAFSGAGERLQDLISGPKLGIPNVAAQIAAQQAAIEGVVTGQTASPSSNALRQKYNVAGTAAQEAEHNREALDTEMERFKLRQRMTELTHTAMTGSRVDQEIAKVRGEGSGFLGLGDANFETFGSKKTERITALLQQRSASAQGAADAQAEITRIQKRLGGNAPPTTHAEGEDLIQRRQAAVDKELEAKQKMREIEQEMTHEKLDQLKATEKEVAEMEKGYRKQIEAEKQRIASMQSKLGLMQPGEIDAIKTVADAFKKQKDKGGQIAPEILEFAQQHGDIFGRQVEEYGLKQFKNRPEFAGLDEVLKGAGQFDQLKNLEGAQKWAADLGQTLRESLKDVQVQGENELKDAAKESIGLLGEAFRKVISDAAVAMKKATADEISKMQNNQGAGARAPAG